MGCTSELADGPGIDAERDEDPGAERQVDEIEHVDAPRLRLADMSGLAPQGSIAKAGQAHKDFIRGRCLCS